MDAHRAAGANEEGGMTRHLFGVDELHFMPSLESPRADGGACFRVYCGERYVTKPLCEREAREVIETRAVERVLEQIAKNWSGRVRASRTVHGTRTAWEYER